MSLFQSKCRYRVVKQYILGSYESNYNIVEEFNYSFSKSDPNLPPDKRFMPKTKNLKELDRKDVLAFLDSLRKSEIADPLHKWIGTYDLYRTHLIRFFKWLYSPAVEPGRRIKPAVVENIQKLRRKEKSS
jgi:hypothetical protein